MRMFPFLSTEARSMSKMLQEMTQDFHARIQELAYLMWESAGRQQGMAMQYWLEAEKQALAAMHAATTKVISNLATLPADSDAAGEQPVPAEASPAVKRPPAAAPASPAAAAPPVAAAASEPEATPAAADEPAAAASAEPAAAPPPASEAPAPAPAPLAAAVVETLPVAPTPEAVAASPKKATGTRKTAARRKAKT